MILVLLIELDMSAGPPLATRGLQVPVHTTTPHHHRVDREREEIYENLEQWAYLLTRLEGVQKWDIRDRVIYTERSNLGRWFGT